MQVLVSWEEIDRRVEQVAGMILKEFPNAPAATLAVYGVPRGGAIVAGLLRAYGFAVCDCPEGADVIVDDIIDSGRTALNYKQHEKPFYALVNKTAEGLKNWIVFPWEGRPEEDIQESVVRILQFLGQDVDTPGLCDTPSRVVRSWSEIYGGYKQSPEEILGKTFPSEGYDEMIVLRDIDFTSMCEHHMLPFSGVAHIGYVPRPGGKVVGISKLARLVDCFSRRLQIQERLTRQVADAIVEHLDPLGVGVVFEAHHQCMGCRGVKKQNARMVTSSMLGLFRENEPARAEFLRFT